MQSNIRLISFPICPFVQKAALLLTLKGVAFAIEYIDLAAKPDWFLRLAPMGKVPVLQVGEVVLYESQVILDYINDVTDARLHPENALTKAQQKALMEFGSNILFTQHFMTTAADEDTFNEHKVTLEQQLDYLEGQLRCAPYFNGEAIFIIDIAFAPLLQRLSFIADNFIAGLYTGYPKLKAWSDAVLALPALARSAPEDLQQLIIQSINEKQGFLAH